MRPGSFERFAGGCAIAGAAGGLAYSIAFVVFLERGTHAAGVLASVLLLIGGVLLTAVFAGLFAHLGPAGGGFALWGGALGIAAGVATAIHGGWDVAVLANPVKGLNGDLPNAVDPRGLATFALSGLSVLIASWIVVTSGALPRRLGYLGMVAGALGIYVYLGRLIILNPKSPAVLPFAVLSGFVVTPVWFGWLGLELRRAGSADGPPGHVPAAAA